MKIRINAGMTLVLVHMIFFPGAALAFETEASFKGTLIEGPTCVLNDNQPIEVDFGDVVITKVNGVDYRETVPYTVVCEEGAEKAMKLRVQGTGAPFDDKVLGTDKDGLGIEMTINGSQLPLNGWINFTYPAMPALMAAPVKDPDISLKAGKFIAIASMMIDFQ